MYFPQAFDKASVEKIEAYYAADKRIQVKEADALRFACNAINVNCAIILNHVSRELSEQLTVRGFRVVEVALDEFLKAGGAAKCLVMKLSRTSH
jgi:ornithine--oxo-acid transaminase